MYYRRKVILSLLQACGGSLPKISLQKLLFLFSSRQQKAEYDFVPYLYGCYSFSAKADLTVMATKGLLIEDDENYRKNDKVNYIASLKDTDKKILVEINNRFGKLSSNTLMKLTYTNYNYYATKSVLAKEIVSEEQYKQILLAKPKNNKTVLYTIGYEGISLEEYLNRLIKNDVKVLVDVRNKPMSMKFGFSKSELTKYCEALGISYIHFPEVGVISEQRQQLDTQKDYDQLFEVYKKENLQNTITIQEKILSLLETEKRIALTCFEANICQCHRKHLAEAIAALPGFQYAVKHI